MCWINYLKLILKKENSKFKYQVSKMISRILPKQIRLVFKPCLNIRSYLSIHTKFNHQKGYFRPYKHVPLKRVHKTKIENTTRQNKNRFISNQNKNRFISNQNNEGFIEYVFWLPYRVISIVIYLCLYCVMIASFCGLIMILWDKI
jgi:hypothetical protein